MHPLYYILMTFAPVGFIIWAMREPKSKIKHNVK